jgi:integrase
MTDAPKALTTERPKRSTKKRDNAPRGVFRHLSGVWAARFTCGAGHIHQERVGSLKSYAIRVYHERRARVHSTPGWCPAAERREAGARTRAESDRERRRVTFREYAAVYLEHAKLHKRSWQSDVGRLALCSEHFGDRQLDEIASLELEQFRDGLLGVRSRATANRYRDLLSALFKRATRDGLVPTNPVRAVGKFREAGERLLWLSADEETAIRETLAPELRPLFTASVHTGLRWGEQVSIRWQDVDMLSGVITVPRSSMVTCGGCRPIRSCGPCSWILARAERGRMIPTSSSFPSGTCRPRSSFRRRWSEPRPRSETPARTPAASTATCGTATVTRSPRDS